MELLIFRLGDTHFGINVAKVREIIQRIKTVDIAFSHETVEGFFKLRS
ncbi:MAG: chemotaxis protein CheV, partial [candidate division Zixibacteria bacterium]|nr:chemotaxis protein CheV [candidate division Zixibacteria bacterium]